MTTVQTTVSPADRFRVIALKDLTVSPTESQAERRAHFDKAALAELAASIKERGVEVPIIVRPEARIDVVESIGGGRWYPAFKKALIDGHNLIGGATQPRRPPRSKPRRSAPSRNTKSLQASVGFSPPRWPR